MRDQLLIFTCQKAVACRPLTFLLIAAGIAAASGPPPDVLSVVSTRAYVQGSQTTVLSGFIISGSGSKQVLLRGLGPSLPVFAPLTDPVLELRDGSGQMFLSNNNWKETQRSAIEATGYAPSQDVESALLVTLPPGHYTMLLRGTSNAVGIGQSEIIDLDTAASSRLDHVTTRATTTGGENTLVGGFTISGPQPRKVFLRGIAPSIQSIAGVLRDPALQLRDGNAQTLVFNNNWTDRQRQEIVDTGVAPTHPRESAIVAILNPGSYTVELTGACGTAGVALVEVFDLGSVSTALALPPSSVRPVCFDSWAIEQGLSGLDAEATADPDRDGLVNLLEYAFGNNPSDSDGSPTSADIVEVNGNKFLSLAYVRPSGDAAPSDLTYTPERTTALAQSGAWFSSSVVPHSIMPGAGSLETVTVRSTLSTSQSNADFLRLRVTLGVP